MSPFSRPPTRITWPLIDHGGCHRGARCGGDPQTPTRHLPWPSCPCPGTGWQSPHHRNQIPACSALECGGAAAPPWDAWRSCRFALRQLAGPRRRPKAASTIRAGGVPAPAADMARMAMPHAAWHGHPTREGAMACWAIENPATGMSARAPAWPRWPCHRRRGTGILPVKGQWAGRP